MTAEETQTELNMDKAATETDAGSQRWKGPKGLLGPWTRGRATVLTAALVILLLVAGVLLKDESLKLSRYLQDECTDCCDDIAIIGAGVSGTYGAWKLRKRGLSVTVYEYSDRIGGRLHTIQFPGIPDINVELGAMRFIPQKHPLLAKTAAALNLSVVDFAPGFGVDGSTLLYQRGVHIFHRDLGTDRNPFQLRPDERHLKHNPEMLKREYFVNSTSYSERDAMNDNAKLYSTTQDGVPLYDQSVGVAYAEMGVSHEAVSLFRANEGNHFKFGDVMASGTVPSHRAADQAHHKKRHVKTIADGMEALPKSLTKEFLGANTRHTLVCNHELSKIEKRLDLSYQLTFLPTETTNGHTQRKQPLKEVTKCAKNVILAVPRLALDSIDWVGFRDPEISKLLKHSIKDCPAAKIFLAYDHPWWRNLSLTFKHSISDLPIRQTYDFGSGSDNKAVLLAGYLDMEDVAFWREVQSRDTGTAAPSGQPYTLSDTGLFHATNFIAELFNVSVHRIPKPLGGAISLWDQFPFGGGWQVWMPGYDWNKVGQKIIKPSDSDDVFVATNGFSPNHGSGWVESALSQTELVIQKMNKI